MYIIQLYLLKITNHPHFDALYQPFMVNLGMVDPIALLRLYLD